MIINDDAGIDERLPKMIARMKFTKKITIIMISIVVVMKKVPKLIRISTIIVIMMIGNDHSDNDDRK